MSGESLADASAKNERKQTIEALWSDLSQLRHAYDQERLHRGRRPVTNKDMADAIGISDSTLGDWLNKRTVVPDWYTLEKLVLFLGGQPEEWLPRWQQAMNAYERRPRGHAPKASTGAEPVIAAPVVNDVDVDANVNQLVEAQELALLSSQEREDPPPTPASHSQMRARRDRSIARLRSWWWGRRRWLVVLVVLAALAVVVWSSVVNTRDRAPTTSEPETRSSSANTQTGSEPETRSSSSTQTDPPPLGTPFLLRSANYPTKYLVMGKGYAALVQVDTVEERDRAALVLSSGLAGDGMSLHLATHPDLYLRHRGGYLRTQAKTQEDKLFAADATYVVEPGLSGQPGFSFRSFNYPDRFIRHSGGVFYVEDEGARPGTPYELDATFTWVPA